MPLDHLALGTVREFVISSHPKLSILKRLTGTKLYFLLAPFNLHETLPAPPALFPALLHACLLPSQFLNYTKLLLSSGPLHMLLLLPGIPFSSLPPYNRHLVS